MKLLVDTKHVSCRSTRTGTLQSSSKYSPIHHDDGNETESSTDDDEDCSDLEEQASRSHKTTGKFSKNVKQFVKKAQRDIPSVKVWIQQKPPSKNYHYFFTCILFCVISFAFVAIALTVLIVVRNFWIQSETAENYSTLGIEGSIDNRPLYKILLIGDSLNNRPYTFWNLGGKLQEALPQYRLEIYNRARDSSKISEVANYIQSDLEVKADMVFLFWDTDVSNVDEDDMTSDQITNLRKEYISNITYVVDVVRSSGANFMAMAGPGLLGEKDYPLLSDFTLRTVFEGKEGMLDSYRAMNVEVASNLQVNYIDFRTAFLDALPFWWMLARYYVTVDGEHPNLYGTNIMVQAYKQQILEWLED